MEKLDTTYPLRTSEEMQFLPQFLLIKHQTALSVRVIHPHLDKLTKRKRHKTTIRYDCKTAARSYVPVTCLSTLNQNLFRCFNRSTMVSNDANASRFRVLLDLMKRGRALGRLSSIHRDKTVSLIFMSKEIRMLYVK